MSTYAIFNLKFRSRELHKCTMPRGWTSKKEFTLNEARELGMKVGLFPIHEYWKDVGRPSDLSRAQADHGASDVK